MEIIILKDNLIEGLSAVDKTIGGSKKLPILKNVRIEADKNKNKVTLTSTDLESATEFRVSAKVVKDGLVIAPYSILSSIVRNLNSEKLSLEHKNNKIIVQADNYEASIKCEDPEEFPVIPSIQNKSKSIEIDNNYLEKSLSQVKTATQYSDIRPEINGIYFNHSKKREFTLVGTDSFRLMEKKLNNKKFKSNLEDKNFIVPLKTVENLLSNLDGEDKIEIFLDPNQVVFESGNLSIISRLVDGDFPDYKNVIPKETGQDVEIDKKEMLNALNVTKVFSGRANDVDFSITEKGKILELKSTDNTLGENNYRAPIKTKGNKKGLSITFNWKYVLEGVKSLESDTIVLGFNGSDKPTLIKGKKEKNISYVVMPIRN